jgi:hypothetical protein
MHTRIVSILLGLAMFGFQRPLAAEEVGSLIAQIKAVGKEGKGNADAGKAWKELVRLGPEVLPEVLAGLDDASPIAANWLRSAVDTLADRALTSGKLSGPQLEAFVRETHHAGPARRLAYEWLVKADKTARDRLLPGMIDDPGAELRREAVEVLLKEAQQLVDTKDEPAALAAYKKLLEAARDHDQVKLVAARLQKFGVKVDLTAQFGFITHWAIVGPFDNAKGVGFQTINPPERGVDLEAEYEGKEGKKVRWFEHVTDAPLGMVDFNKAIGPLKGATAFAYAAVVSPQQRPVELRAASNNAVRLYLNGKEIFFREEYHHGMQMDQHVGKGTLKAGRNEILVKVCQNEQTEDWAQLWSFQLRVCDAIGGPVPITVVTSKLPAGAGTR